MAIKEFTRKHKKVIGSSVMVLVALVAILFIFQPKEEVEAQEKVYSVKTISITPTGNDVYLQYAGLIQPAEIEKATMSLVGKITKIYVKPGDTVVKGQKLFEVDAQQFISRRDSAYHNMESAKAAKNSAKNTYDFATESYNDALKAPTQAEKDEAQAKLDEAKAKEAEYQAEYDRVKEILLPYETEVNEAQAACDRAEAEFQKAYEENEKVKWDEEATEEEKLAAEEKVKAAQENIVKTGEVLREKTANLRQVQIDVRFVEAESNLNLAKADTALKQAEFDRVTKLPTQDDLDVKAKKSRMNTAKFAYESTCATYEASEAAYEAAVKAVDSCVYRAEINGNVVMVIGEEGGIATPIAPVVVVGSNEVIAQFGISQTDIKDVEKGMDAMVVVGDDTFTGTVKNVSLMPDETSRTYTTDVVISSPNEKFHLGELATVKIEIGERTGIWLPISVVMNDGEDYVFTVENSRVVRKNVVITDISNDMVRVTGLENSTNIISEGMKTVKSGNLVNVISEG